MFKVSHRRSLIVISVLFVFVTLTAVTSARHSWRKYHWARQSNPFTIKLGDNVNTTWDLSLVGASADWTMSNVMDTIIVPGGTTGSTCAPTLGRVEVCNAAYGSTGWLGIASIWLTGPFHITQGTAKMNDTYFNMAQYNTSAWRNFVMCQEVGHTFGLDHQDENFNNLNLGTCMDYTNDPTGTAGTNGTLNNEHPNQHDYDQLQTIYSHLDSSTTVGQGVNTMPPAMSNVNLDGPRQWGKVVKTAADGRSSVYELDFGNDQRVITFVIWADAEQHRGNN
jgi:hypothetical protein